MDENLENELSNTMKDAENMLATEAVKQVGLTTATFYKAVVDGGVPRRYATPITIAFMTSLLSGGASSSE